MSQKVGIGRELSYAEDMSEKKDLTQISDLPQAPPVSQESSPWNSTEAEAPPPIDDFESLEDFGKNHPEFLVNESPPEPHLETEAGKEHPLDAFEPSPSEEALQAIDLEVAPEATVGDSSDLAVLNTNIPLESGPTEKFSGAWDGGGSESQTSPPTGGDTLQKIQSFSENLHPAPGRGKASFPFQLKITGQLEPYEKARLLDLLTSEDLGIRELDLEPQFESGQILIPQISEYLGVCIVSALRSAQVQMTLFPALDESLDE